MKFASAYASLSGLEREFCDEFLANLCTENERRLERLTVTLERMSASIDFDGLTEREHDQLQKPIVRAAIREQVEKLASDRDLTPDRIIREHAYIAFANVRRFYPTIGEDGMPIFDATRATDEDWAAVQAIETEETYGPRGTTRKTKLKFHPKQTSLDMLAKWNGLTEAGNQSNTQYRNNLEHFKQSASLVEVAEIYARELDG